MDTSRERFERLLNEHEVATRVGVSVATVRRWRRLHTGPLFLKIGALVRYRPQSVEEWLNSRPTGGDNADRVEEPRLG
jgi:predicted DNA-binding transcriptional regulator AlpA